MSGDEAKLLKITDRFGTTREYTPVTVKNLNTGKSIVINMIDSKVEGNTTSYTIKDGKVYDSSGKAIKNHEIELTRYQVALLEAAAESNGDTQNQKGGLYLDERDLCGMGYAEMAEKKLKEQRSAYTIQTIPDEEYPYNKDADAMEHGVIYANVVNKNDGDTGHLKIQFTDK